MFSNFLKYRLLLDECPSCGQYSLILLSWPLCGPRSGMKVAGGKVWTTWPQRKTWWKTSLGRRRRRRQRHKRLDAFLATSASSVDPPLWFRLTYLIEFLDGPRRMNLSDFGLSSSCTIRMKLWFLVKYLNNYWMNCQNILVQKDNKCQQLWSDFSSRATIRSKFNFPVYDQIPAKHSQLRPTKTTVQLWFSIILLSYSFSGQHKKGNKTRKDLQKRQTLRGWNSPSLTCWRVVPTECIYWRAAVHRL